MAQGLVDAAHQTCPYSKATRGNIDVTLRLVSSRGAPADAGAFVHPSIKASMSTPASPAASQPPSSAAGCAGWSRARCSRASR